MRVDLRVNETEVGLDVEPNVLLVTLLRDHLGLTGTHSGCDSSSCGACTVLLDGLAVKSCAVLAAQADGCSVTTVEGLAAEGEMSVVQEAFGQEHGLQCGFCTPGMVVATTALLKTTPDPDDTEIRHGLEGNLCRCTGYVNIVRAVRLAAARMAGRQVEPVAGSAMVEPLARSAASGPAVKTDDVEVV